MRDAYVSKLYIEILLSVAQLDPNGPVEKMVFIQWLLTKANLDMTLEEAYKESIQLDKKLLNEIVMNIPQDFKIYLIVDAMMVANMDGKSNKEELLFIANLCGVMGLEKEQVEDCSMCAKAALCQSAKGIKKNFVANLPTKMRHYIHYAMIKEMYVEGRQIILKRGDVLQMEWYVTSSSWVRKGTVIASIKFRRYGQGGICTENVLAPRDGVVYKCGYKTTGQNYCYCAVLGYPGDNPEDIKEWIKKQKR